MINQSRLQPLSKPQTARTNQDEFKSLSNLDAAAKTDSPATLFDVLPPSANNSGFAGGNSFSQLLEMSKIEKPIVEEKNGKQNVVADKPQKETKKEAKAEDNGPRKSSKTKEKKVTNNQGNEQALSQLLSQQNTIKPAEQLVAVQGVAQPQAPKEIQAPTQVQAKMDATALSKTVPTDLSAGPSDAAAPQSLNDVMKTLDNKLERLSSLEKNGHLLQTNDKMDQLNELAAKFDDVKFEITPGSTTIQSGNTTVDVNKELQAQELMRKLSEQEWSKNDFALRDLVAQQTANELALEKLGLDRLEQMSQLKSAQFDRLQQQDLHAQTALKDVQAREFQASSQPQWLSYNDLPVDQRAMIDAAAKAQSGQSAGSQLNNNQLHADNQQGLTSRLSENSGKPQLDVASAQNSVGGLQSLASMGAEQNNGAAGKQNSNSNSNSFSQRNDSSSVGGVGMNPQDANKARFDDAKVNEKADARGKEAERAREMARAAALRTQSIASELAVRGGGTAKVQIKDSQLGVVELRINMTDKNKVSVELIANSDRIKNELQKQSEELKSGLEKHNVVLEGVHFATDVKLGDNTSQNQSQSDNSRANQQQQQQQSMSSFSQGNGNNSSQQNFNGGERFFDAPRNNLNNPAATNGNVRKIYSGKNEAQTNVQRTANGSLKVIA